MDNKVMDLLPWYANETLGDVERDWVSAHLDDHPVYRAQLRFYRRLREEIKAIAPAAEPTAGLDQVMRRIALSTLTVPAAPPRKETTGQRPFWRRLLGEGWTPRMAYSLGLTVIAMQAVIISALLVTGAEQAETFSDTRSRATVAAAAGPFIKISFKSGVSETDVRFLLVSVGASIVGGPSQLGDYYLYFETKRTDWATQQLRTSPIVEDVAVIATLPPAKE